MVELTPKTEEFDDALVVASKIWGNPRMHLPDTYCTDCGWPPKEKQRCVCDAMSGEAYCLRHWMTRWIKKYRTEEKKVYSLDLGDFAKI